MTQTYSRDRRKIDPSKKGSTLADGSPKDNDRVEIGPTKLAFDEWKSAGVQPPNLDKMRQYRLDRICEQLAKHDMAGVLLFDPLNIRYATDSTNMQLWNTHNPFRACLVTADGHMVLWDYKDSPFLSEFNPLVKEVRSGAGMFYFSAGDKTEDIAKTFTAEVNSLLEERAGNNRRLAVDKIMVHGLRGLESHGIIVEEGELIMEHARSIKGEDDIKAMRCSIHACEAAMAEMEAKAAPGMSEDEVWAILHAGNISRGGEWIETRLMASGPRTNPWFQECGPRIIQNNEILAFDTDLVGCYGICTDISRTWFLGDGEPTDEMKSDYRMGYDHIQENMAMLKPGVSFKDLTFGGHQLPPEYQKQKYPAKFHGVGLCDEWPHINYPDSYVEGAFEAVLEPGMVLCVEALISHEGRDFSIKLEDQVLITESGYENLTSYPFSDKLMG